jgi:hypothetical protein
VKGCALTVDLQRYHMSRLWPQFTSETNRGGWIKWTGTLQPGPLTNTYLVEIAYTIPKRPKVIVLEPELQLHPGADHLPHIYPDGTLCLHMLHEWRADFAVADTIVPWTSAWLYFYEAWAGTGLWRGEGTHPDLHQHKSSQEKVA